MADHALGVADPISEIGSKLRAPLGDTANFGGNRRQGGYVLRHILKGSESDYDPIPDIVSERGQRGGYGINDPPRYGGACGQAFPDTTAPHESRALFRNEKQSGQPVQIG